MVKVHTSTVEKRGDETESGKEKEKSSNHKMSNMKTKKEK